MARKKRNKRGNDPMNQEATNQEEEALEFEQSPTADVEDVEAETAVEAVEVAEDTAEDTVTEPEPEPEPEVTQEPVAVQTQSAPVVEGVQNNQNDPRFHNQLQLLDDQFDRYRKAMASGRPVGEVEGTRQQVALWRMIDGVLRKQGPEFNVLFGRLLALIDSESRKGVLTPRLRYRFFPNLPLGRDEARSFEAILSALISVANPRDRTLTIRQVDLARVFNSYPDKTALARVVDYFSV